jgi:Flp pilus assembly CpaE family ATPase
MVIAGWSAKGGSGTTVVVAALASLLARRSPFGARLVDLAGDAPAALGHPEPSSGLTDLLAPGATLDHLTLGRVELALDSRLALVPRGRGPWPAGAHERTGDLLGLLATDPRPAVVDCGTAPDGLALELARHAEASLLVLRPCYLALRRASALAWRPSAIVLVDEPARALDASDVEAVLGVPVRAVVPLDPAVARAVDAGLLAARLPASLARSLAAAA